MNSLLAKKNLFIISLKKTKHIFLSFVFIFSYFFPKKNNLWIFGSWQGEKYSDNSKFLFEYINSNFPQIEAVWFSRNEKIIRYLKKNGHKAEKFYSLKSFLICLRAKVIITCVNKDTDLPGFFFTKKNVNFNLWHGNPLKILPEDFYLKRSPFFAKIFIIFWIFFKEKSFFCSEHFTPASSKLDQKIFKRCFTGESSITGYPRNDIFYKNRRFIINRLPREIKKKILNKKVIFYCPTFRGSEYKNEFTKDFLRDYKFNFQKFNTFLEKNDAVLFIKYHNHDFKKISDFNKLNQKYIFLINNYFFGDPYPVLKVTDILITDYSSIYFDFLHTLKPIIFTPFDLEDYKEERGFYYDYEDVTPGPKAYSWEEVMNNIEIYLNNSDKDLEFRKKIHNQFNKYHDGNNCSRVTEKILETLNN